MKLPSLILSVLLVGVPILSHADEASHRAAAMKLLAKVNSQDTMMAAFPAMLDPLSKQLAQQGIPKEGVEEVRKAVMDWLKKEVNFDVLAPKLAELYMKEFTEQELNDIVKFYETPLGQKLLAKLPVLMQQGAVIGQQAVQAKQADLQKIIMEIVSKYLPGAAGGAGGAPGGAK